MSDSVVALDLGGTHVSAGRIDVDAARVEDYVRVDLPSDADGRGLLTRIVGAAAEVANARIDGLGVAAPGPFDYSRGVSLLTNKLEPLYGLDLRHELAVALEVAESSIVFVNDAEAFLVGEWWVGAAAGHARAAGVTLGTGLGSAFLEHGRVVDDDPRVPPEGSLHLVSYRGLPVEESISRDALIGRYGAPYPDVRELAALARGGDERALLAFSEVAVALGEVVAPWLDSFEATCFVLGGSIARAWDLLGPGLRRTLDGLDRLETIRPAVRVDEAALLGAARHACFDDVPRSRKGR